MLFAEFDWLAALAASAHPALRIIPEATIPAFLNRVIARKSPSAAFRVLSQVPYYPPIPSGITLLMEKLHTEPHPYLNPDQLPARADNNLSSIANPPPKGWLSHQTTSPFPLPHAISSHPTARELLVPRAFSPSISSHAPIPFTSTASGCAKSA